MIFTKMFTSKCRQIDIRPTVLSPVSLLLGLIIGSFVVTGNKIIIGVMEPMKIQGYGVITSVKDTGNNFSSVTTTTTLAIFLSPVWCHLHR
jgi:hypothetical protein